MNTLGSQLFSKHCTQTTTPQGDAILPSISYGSVSNFSSSGCFAMKPFDDQRRFPHPNSSVTTDNEFRSYSYSPRLPQPAAVPHLTKKARGRQVPTKEALLKHGLSGRSYACHVEACRKVFTRSEHLKRHILSIHTNERPFRCDEPECGKSFTRHDNLLQHQRSHKDPPTHSRNGLFDSSGPLERVYNLRDPLTTNTPSAGSMGVLLPSPLTSIPMTFDRAPLDGVCDHGYETRYSPQIPVNLLYRPVRKSLPIQMPHVPCFHGESRLRPYGLLPIEDASPSPQPQFIHVSIPISELTLKKTSSRARATG